MSDEASPTQNHAGDHKRGNPMLTLAMLVATIAIALGCGLYWVQPKLLYPGLMRQADESPQLPPDWESHWLEVEGEWVETWFAPGFDEGNRSESRRPALIFAHGNGELIDDWARDLTPFRYLGMHLLLVEYPGYGRSGGQPSQTSIHQMMLAAHAMLVERDDVDADRIVLYGRSLGGGAVGTIVGESKIAALILQSTFTSVGALAGGKLGWPDFLLRDVYDTLSAVEGYSGPVLVIHGKRDDLIPHHHGRTLAEAATQSEFITYPCAHNDCPPNLQQYWTDLRSFLVKHDIVLDSE